MLISRFSLNVSENKPEYLCISNLSSVGSGEAGYILMENFIFVRKKIKSYVTCN
jgi:hypothetical protein